LYNKANLLIPPNRITDQDQSPVEPFISNRLFQHALWFYGWYQKTYEFLKQAAKLGSLGDNLVNSVSVLVHS